LGAEDSLLLLHHHEYTMAAPEWEVSVLEKGRITIPRELRTRLNLSKGDKVRFRLQEGKIYLLVPKGDLDAVESSRGILRGVEPELGIEELGDAILDAFTPRLGEEAEE